MNYIFLETADSTLSYAAQRQAELQDMTMISAYEQLAGRGQRGNSWESEPGKNLTVALFCRPEAQGVPEGVPMAVRQFRISEATALSVRDTLLRHGIEATLKWPNDIYIRNKKVCGMLIENILDRDLVGTSIIGIGINLNQTDFPPELVNPTSVFLASGEKHQPEDVLVEFMEIFHALLAQLAENEGIEKLRNNYVSRLYRLGSTEKYCDSISGTYFSGKIKGISDEGLLLMEMPDNSLRTFAFKELSYVI